MFVGKPTSILPVGPESKTALAMTDAGAVFLASLTRDQEALALWPLKSEERLNWDYRPHPRQGLSLKMMSSHQQRLALALMAAGLSPGGLGKALGIMALEKVLQELEGPGGRFQRDPDLYYFTLFGRPNLQEAWAWRVEGHHLSLNFLVMAGERVASAPYFFGANPARVNQGPLVGWRLLPAEEDLARSLLLALGENQRSQALIEAAAPADILTGNDARVNLRAPAGLPYGDMTADQQQTLMKLILEYAARLPEEVADVRLNRIDRDGRKFIHFAWAGSARPNEPHYYRIHGPGFLIEYDNTQNHANHIHSVWRDFKDDWGEDLLASHYAKAHGRGAHQNP
jgi:hypothetical protein